MEKFVIGRVYRSPFDNFWLAKVIDFRGSSGVRVLIKSVRDKSWHPSEAVTLRISSRLSSEYGCSVAIGQGWEFHSDIIKVG